MKYFDSDYLEGCAPEILEALQKSNFDQTPGYGKDSYCESAKEKIKAACDCPQADVHFLVGGTQTNAIVIDAILQKYEGVIAAETGHVNVHEAGAIEHSGHKVMTLPSHCGKIDAAELATYLEGFWNDPSHEHMVFPGMVYISYPTEYGTLYTKSELSALREVADKYGMSLFLDGARLGYGLTSNESDVTSVDIAKVSDVFYFGGTKCGAMFGEAVVFKNKALSQDFRSYIKMGGGMLAKGWLLGLQFYTLFKDGLYFEICKRANEYAMMIKKAFEDKNIPFYYDSPTNQQFVILDSKMMEKLSEKYVFEYEKKIDENHACVRFCTAWSTRFPKVFFRETPGVQ